MIMVDHAIKAIEAAKSFILTYLEAYPDIGVILFGSRARGTALPHSDIDIGLLPKTGNVSPVVLSDLCDLAEQSNIPYQIDIVDFSAVSEDFRRSALKGSIVWKE